LTKKFEPHGETALHLAVKYRHEDIVKWLLQLEADIHATDCVSLFSHFKFSQKPFIVSIHIILCCLILILS